MDAPALRLALGALLERALTPGRRRRRLRLAAEYMEAADGDLEGAWSETLDLLEGLALWERGSERVIRRTVEHEDGAPFLAVEFDNLRELVDWCQERGLRSTTTSATS